jgi:hypothetical protein
MADGDKSATHDKKSVAYELEKVARDQKSVAR